MPKVVVKNNTFEFDEKTFKQKGRIAIGTKFLPPYAVLVMAELEGKKLENFEKRNNDLVEAHR